MSPEQVVDDAAAQFDTAMLEVANIIFADSLPTPTVSASFRVNTQEELAAVIRAFPDANWRLYHSLTGDWWHGSHGPIALLVDRRVPEPEPVSTEDALAALLGGAS